MQDARWKTAKQKQNTTTRKLFRLWRALRAPVDKLEMIVDKEMADAVPYGDLMFEGFNPSRQEVSPLLKRWDELLKRNTTAVAGGEEIGILH